jgi:hypothetical protein
MFVLQLCVQRVSDCLRQKRLVVHPHRLQQSSAASTLPLAALQVPLLSSSAGYAFHSRSHDWKKNDQSFLIEM